MLRLIGLAAVIFVLYAGYSSLVNLYEGNTTPKEAFEETRQRAAEVIAPKPKASGVP